MADRYYNNVFWPKVTTCPSCGKSARPIHKRMFPPDPDRVFCRFCGEEVKLVTNRLTNGDKLRAMSDEELAKYLFERGNCTECCYGICAYQDRCRGPYSNEFCLSQIETWLKQEVEDGR